MKFVLRGEEGRKANKSGPYLSLHSSHTMSCAETFVKINAKLSKLALLAVAMPVSSDLPHADSKAAVFLMAPLTNGSNREHLSPS